jgi:hypothetical protein
MIKEWAAERAKGKEMAYAEAYRVVTLESDEDWAKWKGKVVGRDDDEPKLEEVPPTQEDE